jgi:hypothetical protein
MTRRFQNLNYITKIERMLHQMFYFAESGIIYVSVYIGNWLQDLEDIHTSTNFYQTAAAPHKFNKFLLKRYSLPYNII